MGMQEYPQYIAKCPRCEAVYSSEAPIDNCFCPSCPKGGMRGVLNTDEIDWGPQGNPAVDATEEVVDTGFAESKLSQQEATELGDFCRRYHETHGTSHGSTALYWALVGVIGRFARQERG